MSHEFREQLATKLFGVTLDTLELAPQRALKFSRGVGTNRAIRSIMQQRGFGPAVHNELWRLLQETSGRKSPNAAETFDPTVAEAIVFVDPYDEIIIEIIDASVAPRFPDQAAYLRQGLKAATGMGGVLNVNTLLLRATDLEKSPERKTTRKTDQAALDLLAERGINPELRAKLAERIKVATSGAEVEPVDQASVEAADESYVRALGALYGFYDEWSRIARVAVKRRDYLMQLGLAHPKTEKTDPTASGTPVST
jgi:hypothetical protein